MALLTHVLKTSMDGDSTTFLGSFVVVPHYLTSENIFPNMSILNFPVCNLLPLCCAVPSTAQEFGSIAFGTPWQTAEGCS